MAQTKIEIDGMSCAGCASRITSALQRDARVEYAVVDFATKTGVVRGNANFDDIKKIVESVGYHLREHDAKTADEHQKIADAELAAAIKKITVSAVISAIVVFLAMGPWTVPYNALIQGALTTIFLVGPASGFFSRFLKQLGRGFVTMDALVSIGMISAWAISVALAFQGHDHLYFESAVMIGFFVLLGKFIEDRVRLKSVSDISRLMKMAPKRVFKTADEKLPEEVEANSIQVGDTIYVRPGDMVAFDGVLIEPPVSLDESILTGESQPITKKPGDTVSSGSLNSSGVGAYIKVSRVGEDTTLAQIIKLMDEARLSRPAIQKLADRISSVFVPLVMALAIMTFGFLYLSGVGLEPSIMRALSVLVVSCPCALGLATPVAWVAGLGRAARAGILIKSYDGLDALRKVDAFVFDKTGTLSMGQPEVHSVIESRTISGEEYQELFSALSHSSHPLARSIMNWIKSRVDTSTAPLSKLISDVAGQGVECEIKGKTPSRIKFGRMSFIVREAPSEWAEVMRGRQMSVAVSKNDQPLALFSLSDKIRPDAADVLRRLAAMKISVHIASGDRQEAVEELVKALPAVSSVSGGMSPQTKKALIDRLRGARSTVAFIGDGINDAPALASADVGISIGGGSDLAAQSSSLVLQRQGISGILDAIKLSGQISKIIHQNFFWAFIYNIAAIPVAAAGQITPMWASAAMAMSSVTVVLNALRLRLWKL